MCGTSYMMQHVCESAGRVPLHSGLESWGRRVNQLWWYLDQLSRQLRAASLPQSNPRSAGSNREPRARVPCRCGSARPHRMAADVRPLPGRGGVSRGESLGGSSRPVARGPAEASQSAQKVAQLPPQLGSDRVPSRLKPSTPACSTWVREPRKSATYSPQPSPKRGSLQRSGQHDGIGVPFQPASEGPDPVRAARSANVGRQGCVHAHGGSLDTHPHRPVESCNPITIKPAGYVAPHKLRHTVAISDVRSTGRG